MYNNRNIVLHELIGLRVNVVKSRDKKQVGTSGKVIDETKNTLVIETEDRTVQVVKAASAFRFYFGRKSFLVGGEEINFRPHERLEKSLKYYKRRSEK